MEEITGGEAIGDQSATLPARPDLELFTVGVFPRVHKQSVLGTQVRIFLPCFLPCFLVSLLASFQVFLLVSCLVSCLVSLLLRHVVLTDNCI